MRQTFFVILGHIFPFYHPPPPSTHAPLNYLKNQNLKKMKKMPEDLLLLWILVYHKWRSYDTWFLKYKVQQTEIVVILGHFCPFSPLTTWKIKILKLRKTPGDIIILHKCTKNHDHILYCSLDMACNRFNYYFSLWTIFCPFNSLTAQKTKILKK